MWSICMAGLLEVRFHKGFAWLGLCVHKHFFDRSLEGHNLFFTPLACWWTPWIYEIERISHWDDFCWYPPLFPSRHRTWSHWICNQTAGYSALLGWIFNWKIFSKGYREIETIREKQSFDGFMQVFDQRQSGLESTLPGIEIKRLWHICFAEMAGGRDFKPASCGAQRSWTTNFRWSMCMPVVGWCVDEKLHEGRRISEWLSTTTQEGHRGAFHEAIPFTGHTSFGCREAALANSPEIPPVPSFSTWGSPFTTESTCHINMAWWRMDQTHDACEEKNAPTRCYREMFEKMVVGIAHKAGANFEQTWTQSWLKKGWNRHCHMMPNFEDMYQSTVQTWFKFPRCKRWHTGY